MKNVYEEMIKSRKASVKLRNLAFDDKAGYEKQNEIRKEQDKIYNKYKFCKGLLSAMRKEGVK